MTTFWWLLVGHAVCDYPLQGDFLARGKNHKAPLPGVPWYQCLAAHALIQGGAVALTTGSVALGVAEAAAHGVIDFGKCSGWYGFNTDQVLHIFCKLAWTGAMVLAV
jgi:hypothetical protein